MIDVYAAADLFPAGSDRQLAEELCHALLRAEGVPAPGPTHLNNTGAYIHRMPPPAVHTAAADSARTVRIQVVTPPGVLSRDGQQQLVKDATDIVVKISGDASQAGRTWDLLTEAAEGGWGSPAPRSGVPSLQRSPVAVRNDRRGAVRKRLRHRIKPPCSAARPLWIFHAANLQFGTTKELRVEPTDAWRCP